MGAIKEVLVPDIGDFKEVDVIEILVKPGDAVVREQSLITLESDKATMEIPSPDAGVVKEIRVKVGDKISEGVPIVVLEAIADASKHLKRWMKPQRRRVDFAMYPLARNRVVPQPLGVVGVIVPWNFPLNLSFVPLAAILAAGIRPDTLLMIGQFDHWATPYAKELQAPSLNTVAAMSLELTDATGSGSDIVRVSVQRTGRRSA